MKPAVGDAAQGEVGIFFDGGSGDQIAIQVGGQHVFSESAKIRRAPGSFARSIAPAPTEPDGQPNHPYNKAFGKRRSVNVDHWGDQHDPLEDPGMVAQVPKQDMGAHGMTQADQGPGRAGKKDFGDELIQIPNIFVKTLNMPLVPIPKSPGGEPLASPVKAVDIEPASKEIPNGFEVLFQKLGSPGKQQDRAASGVSSARPDSVSDAALIRCFHVIDIRDHLQRRLFAVRFRRGFRKCRSSDFRLGWSGAIERSIREIHFSFWLFKDCLSSDIGVKIMVFG